MSKDDSTISSDEITIKKSTYSNMIKLLVAAIAIAAFVGGYSLATFSNNDSITKEDLQEVIKTLQKPTPPTPIQQPTQNQPTLLSLVSIDDDPIKGNADAPVTIVEFSDFQCPFCSRFYEQTLPLIDENYIQTGKAKLVYRDYPLGFHQNAKAAHIASECADSQDSFWQYHDVLFEKQSEWQSLTTDAASERFLAYADELGLDGDRFSTCTKDLNIEQEILFDTQEGVKYGISGTPTFFIGNEKHGFTKLIGAQPYEAFAGTIESKMD